MFLLALIAYHSMNDAAMIRMDLQQKLPWGIYAISIKRIYRAKGMYTIHMYMADCCYCLLYTHMLMYQEKYTDDTSLKSCLLSYSVSLFLNHTYDPTGLQCHYIIFLSLSHPHHGLCLTHACAHSTQLHTLVYTACK